MFQRMAKKVLELFYALIIIIIILRGFEIQVNATRIIFVFLFHCTGLKFFFSYSYRILLICT